MAAHKPGLVSHACTATTRQLVGTALSAVIVCTAGCGGAGTVGSGSSTAAGPGGSGSPASQYLQIANAGNARLDRDVDALTGRDKNDLSAAEADLADESATERLFDRRLRTIRFPRSTEMIAERLYAANESRAKLSAAAASSRTLPELRAYMPRVVAANGPVEDQVRQIRHALQLPPPDTS